MQPQILSFLTQNCQMSVTFSSLLLQLYNINRLQKITQIFFIVLVLVVRLFYQYSWIFFIFDTSILSHWTAASLLTGVLCGLFLLESHKETWISLFLCAVPIGRHTKLASSTILTREGRTTKDKNSVSRQPNSPFCPVGQQQVCWQLFFVGCTHWNLTRKLGSLYFLRCSCWKARQASV